MLALVEGTMPVDMGWQLRITNAATWPHSVSLPSVSPEYDENNKHHSHFSETTQQCTHAHHLIMITP